MTIYREGSDDTRSLCVLVVDDASDARDSLKTLLELQGYNVELAADGRAAVAAAIHSRPDLIVIDIAMPGMDGLAATRELREKPETRKIPIVVVSAYADQARWIANSVDSGVTEILVKPVSWPKLQEVLDRLLGDRN